MSGYANLLIVDDEPSICELLSCELGESGYTCSTASNANEAINLLKTAPYDLALLDIRLPSSSGIKLLELIRTDFRDTRAIMVTALNDAQTAVAAMKLGADDYITKPFDLALLLSSIEKVLSEAKRGNKLSRGSATPCVVSKEQLIDSEIDLIAMGVVTRYNMALDLPEKVIEETAAVARWLSIPDRRIKRWEILFRQHHQQIVQRINTSISKIEKSPLTHLLFCEEYNVPQNGLDQPKS